MIKLLYILSISLAIISCKKNALPSNDFIFVGSDGGTERMLVFDTAKPVLKFTITHHNLSLPQDGEIEVLIDSIYWTSSDSIRSIFKNKSK